jgi:hypothetical protein
MCMLPREVSHLPHAPATLLAHTQAAELVADKIIGAAIAVMGSTPATRKVRGGICQ